MESELKSNDVISYLHVKVWIDIDGECNNDSQSLL
jgi:hypothetical protein